jgi:ubiquinone/menaquinone biosynthesis C-methylase UbiE
MDPNEYLRMFKIEDEHWWYYSLHQLLLKTITSLSLPQDSTILDAGCGTGGLAVKIESLGRATCFDYGILPLQLARKRNLRPIQASLNEIPFKNMAFNLSMCISVLDQQSIEEDKALQGLMRVIKPNGYLLMVVPAYNKLFSHHDRAIYSKKRFSFKEIKKLIEKQGFRLMKIKFLFSFLFPVFLAKRIIERAWLVQRAVSDLILPPNSVNQLLKWICLVEWKFTEFLPLCFGSSILILAAKKEPN